MHVWCALAAIVSLAAAANQQDPFAFACSVTRRNPLFARLHAKNNREPVIIDAVKERIAAETLFASVAGSGKDEVPRSAWDSLREHLPEAFRDTSVNTVSANKRTIARRDFSVLVLFARLADAESRKVCRDDVHASVVPSRLFDAMDLGRRGGCATWAQWRDALVPMFVFGENAGGKAELGEEAEVVGMLTALAESVGHRRAGDFGAHVYRMLFANMAPMTALDATMVYRFAKHASDAMLLGRDAFASAVGPAANPRLFEAASGGARSMGIRDWYAYWMFAVLTDDLEAMSATRAACHVPADALDIIGARVTLEQWRAFVVYNVATGDSETTLTGGEFEAAGLGTLRDFERAASGADRLTFAHWLSYVCPLKRK